MNRIIRRGKRTIEARVQKLSSPSELIQFMKMPPKGYIIPPRVTVSRVGEGFAGTYIPPERIAPNREMISSILKQNNIPDERIQSVLARADRAGLIGINRGPRNAESRVTSRHEIIHSGQWQRSGFPKTKAKLLADEVVAYGKTWLSRHGRAAGLSLTDRIKHVIKGTARSFQHGVKFNNITKWFSSQSRLIQFLDNTAEAVPRADIHRKIVKRKIIKKPIQFAAFDMYRAWMDPIDKSSPGRKNRRALQDAAGRSVDLPASKPPRVSSGGIGRSLSQERIEEEVRQNAAREVTDQMEGIRDHPGVGAPSTEEELARHKKAMQGPELYHPENEAKGSVIHTRNKPAPVDAWKYRDPKAWLVANKAQGRHADLDPEKMTAMQKVSMQKEAQTFRDTEAKTLRSLRGRIQEMRKAVSPGFKPSENFNPHSGSNNIVGGMKPEKWEPKGRLRIGPGLSTPEMVHGAISHVDQKAGDRIATVKSRLARAIGTLKNRVSETIGIPEGPARHAQVKGYLEGMIPSEGPAAMDITKKIDPTRSERIQKAMSRPGREWSPERVERSRRAIAKLEHQANSAEYLSQVRQGIVKQMVAAPKASALPDGYVPGAALKKLGRIAGATALVGAGAYGIRKYLNRKKEEPKQLKMSARGLPIRFEYRTPADAGTWDSLPSRKGARWKGFFSPVSSKESKRLEDRYQKDQAGARTMRDAQIIGGGALIGHKLIREGRDRITGRTTLYHGTTSEGAKKILSEGLRPASETGASGIAEKVLRGGAAERSKNATFLTHEAGAIMGGARAYAGQAEFLKRNPDADLLKPLTQVRRYLSPLTHGALGKTVKYRIPLWKTEIQSQIIPNPEKATDPVANYILNKRTKVFHGPAPDEYRVGSPGYSKQSMAEWKQYAKGNKGRIAKGAALAIGGIGMLAGVARYTPRAIEKRRERKESLRKMGLSARGQFIQFVVPHQVKQMRRAILTAHEPAKRWRATALADHVMSESEKRGGTAQRFFPNLYSNLPPKEYKLHGRPVDAQRMAREQSRAGHEEKLIQRLVEQGKIVRTGKPISKEALANYPVNAIGKLPTVEEVMSQDIVGDVSSRVSNHFAKHAGTARAAVAEERRMPLAIIQHAPSPLADKIAATERRAIEAEGLVGGLRASVASSKKAAAESASRHSEEMKRQIFRGDRNLLIGATATGAAGLGGGYLIGRRKKEVQFSEKKRELTPWQKVGISAAASGAVLGAIPAFRRGSTFSGVAKSIGTGAGIGSIVGGGGTYVGTKILGNPRKDDPIGTTKRAAVGGAIAGLGLGAAGAIALRRGHFKGVMQDWRPIAYIRRAGAPMAIATGAGAGALIAGSHAADEGQQVDTMRNLKKSIRMSSKLKPIGFAIEAPLSGKLAADRYRKKIADEDFDRRDANVLRSSGAGAVLGGMLGGRRGALAGAGLGAASVLGIRQATKSGKDMYGERSRGAKQAEGLPWKIAAIGAAGLGGRRIYNKLKSLRNTILGRKGGLIEFRDWSDKWIGDNVNYTARGEDVSRWGGRGGRLIRDIGRKARGEEHKDSRGRVQIPEWEKPWAKKAMIIGGVGLALGAGVLAHGKLKGLANEARASYGINQTPRPAARFAHNVMEGNVSHSIKNRIGAFVPGPVKRGYQRVKGFFGNVARDIEHKAASKLDKINEAVENESNMVVTAKGKIHNARKVDAAVARQQEAVEKAKAVAEKGQANIRVMRSPEEAAAEELRNTIHGKPRTFSSNEKPIQFDAWDIKERSRNTAIVRTSDYNKTRKDREHKRMSKSTGYLLRDLGIAAAGGIGLWAGHRRGFAKAAGARPLVSPAARVIEEAPPQIWIPESIRTVKASSLHHLIHLNSILDTTLT